MLRPWAWAPVPVTVTLSPWAKPLPKFPIVTLLLRSPIIKLLLTINNILVIKHAFYYLNKDLCGYNVVIDCIKELLALHNSSIKYIMVHNLGGFDGVYIVGAILKLEDYNIKDFNILVDASGNYIQIQYKKLIFRDSYRIFPAPLSKLSQMCNTVTCKSELNHDSVTLDMIKKKDFYEASSEYLKNDINILYEVVEKLKIDLIENYQLPLRKVYSASNMAFQVYRTKYQKRAIEASCKRSSDIAHEAFYGGSTQLVKSDMLKGYYYDVNSLYPAMMLKPLPVEKLNTVNFKLLKCSELQLITSNIQR